MDRLSVELNHCFGISNMHHEFDFTRGNVITVYARNGLMKTSFAKTFKKIQLGKADELKDEIFGIAGTATVKSDDTDITPESIFVINSFESTYQADVTPLLINEGIKVRLQEVLRARDSLYKELEKNSELKIKRTSAGKTVYELEPVLIRDFGFEENSFLVNVLSLRPQSPEVDFSAVQYQRIFDETVLKKINSAEFQSKIQEYIIRSEEIYASYTFLSKGNCRFVRL